MQITAAPASQMIIPNSLKRIAIALDERVYSAPVVHTEIPNGNSQITGHFTLEEAKDLANILKAGSLPAPVKIVEEAIGVIRCAPDFKRRSLGKIFLCAVSSTDNPINTKHLRPCSAIATERHDVVALSKDVLRLVCLVKIEPAISDQLLNVKSLVLVTHQLRFAV